MGISLGVILMVVTAGLLWFRHRKQKMAAAAATAFAAAKDPDLEAELHDFSPISPVSPRSTQPTFSTELTQLTQPTRPNIPELGLQEQKYELADAMPPGPHPAEEGEKMEIHELGD